MKFTDKIANYYKQKRKVSFYTILSEIKQIEMLAVFDRAKILPTDLLAKVADILAKYHIKFVVAGGFAYAAHATARATEDVDILVFVRDIKVLEQTLINEGFKHKDILDYQKPARAIIKYEYKGRDLDIIEYRKYPDFVDFLLQTSITKKVANTPYPYLGLEGLILTKLCSFRYKDKSDIVYLIDKSPDLDTIKKWCSYLGIMDRFLFMTEDHSKEK